MYPPPNWSSQCCYLRQNCQLQLTVPVCWHVDCWTWIRTFKHRTSKKCPTLPFWVYKSHAKAKLDRQNPRKHMTRHRPGKRRQKKKKTLWKSLVLTLSCKPCFKTWKWNVLWAIIAIAHLENKSYSCNYTWILGTISHLLSFPILVICPKFS